tara:strand:- start:201 stop:362 length:162 start_codon:yes stop_codon:yes gene_type:complete
MYYLAKFFQFVGITVLTVSFIAYLPDPMGYNILFYAIFFFIAGWIIEKYLLKG